jgi:hypothetical protein
MSRNCVIPWADSNGLFVSLPPPLPTGTNTAYSGRRFTTDARWDQSSYSARQRYCKADHAMANRLFCFVSVICHPFRAEGLVELLAFNFQGELFWLFRSSWRQKDLVKTLQTSYSSLLAIAKDEETAITDFTFRCKNSSDARSLPTRVPMFLIIVTRDGLRRFPLTEHAAGHWLNHFRSGILTPTRFQVDANRTRQKALTTHRNTCFTVCRFIRLTSFTSIAAKRGSCSSVART